MVYALLVERVEARGTAQFHASVTMLAAGAKVDPVDPDQHRQMFDRWLLEEPKPAAAEDAEKAETLRALGLR